jgi:hypothetical protein
MFKSLKVIAIFSSTRVLCVELIGNNLVTCWFHDGIQLHCTTCLLTTETNLPSIAS